MNQRFKSLAVVSAMSVAFVTSDALAECREEQCTIEAECRTEDRPCGTNPDGTPMMCPTQVCYEVRKCVIVCDGDDLETLPVPDVPLPSPFPTPGLPGGGPPPGLPGLGPQLASLQ